jgi:hypothetical protein
VLLSPLRKIVFHLQASHTSGGAPNAFESRSAISAEMLLLPFTKLFNACRVTPRCFAASITVNSNGSMLSWRQCAQMGRVFMRMTLSPLVIVEQIDVVDFAGCETEDNPPVDSHS